MSYLDDLGAEIKHRVPTDLIPNRDTALLFRLYAMLALAKGHNVSARDVHNAWSVWMQEQDPDHRSLKPYEDLDAKTKAADEPFVKAIRDTAIHASTP